MIKGGRIIYLDIVRVMACAMIILMHSPFKDVDHSSIVVSTISYMTGPAIGLFFMVSGALLLDNKLTARQFLKRRFSKIAIPTLVFSLIDVFAAVYRGNIEWALVPRMILSMPITAQGWYGTIWFMYTLAGLYLLTPILSRWVQKASKREIEFYLLLWIITLVFPLLESFINLDSSQNSLLYHFHGAVGYYILGYYINKRFIFSHRIKLVLFLIAVFCVATPIACKYLCPGIDFYKHFWYYTLPCALQAVFWFLLAKKVSDKVHKPHPILVMTSNYAFGIYLVHIFIMRDLIRNISFFHQIHGLLQISSTTVLTFALSWLFCYLISKTKVSKYIIGY